MSSSYWVDGIELKLIERNNTDHAWIRKKMQNSIARSSNVESYNIVSIHKILNCRNWKGYFGARKKVYRELNRYSEEKRLFHASPHAMAIGQEGFDISFAKSSGNFGAGKINAYISLSTRPKVTTMPLVVTRLVQRTRMASSVCERTMLICRVALGKKYVYDGSSDTPPRNGGYHSLYYDNEVPQYVIYDDKQAYPGYIIRYTANYES